MNQMKRTITVGFMAFLALAAFAAFAADAPPLRIALIADTHTNSATTGDQAKYKERLDHVIASVNSADADLVLIAGDLTQSGKPEDMAGFQTQIKGFHAPVWVVAGNHDVGAKHIPGKEGGVTAARVDLYEKNFGPSFWSKTQSGVRVIGIDSSLLGSGLSREADQWAFLETELDAPRKTPTLLVTHYPLFLTTADEPGGIYWNMEPQPRARLLTLLRRGGVRAVLSGHLHRPLVALQDGIFLYTTPPVSFGLPSGKQSEGWTLVTVSQDRQIAADFHQTDAPAPEEK